MFKIAIFVVCVFAVAFLVGCGSPDNIARTALLDSLDSPDVADPGNDNGSSDGNGGEGDNGSPPHSPEPMTMALLGGGLVAYALLKR